MAPEATTTMSSTWPSPTATALEPPQPTISYTSFSQQFMGRLITEGSTGDKVLRGFLAGVILGICLAAMTCCWIPVMRCLSRRWHRRRGSPEMQQVARGRRRRERRLRGELEGRIDERHWFG
ncbi:hypothetical protein B0I35DRAFT_413415 [Stachybotrys elegans]|uniref:Uncharacterized protein n=1 Tax=Stachybotrys elegans TaxID=80388 RepID=A0A8K0SK56_9HYPO|nr:hypothetical protein B0I35DRAFT_413415 [Stachybotrys elegans]